MPHYLCKLRPPRPTFIDDMTPDEALLMRAIELDPGFGPAYAFLAAAKVTNYVSNWSASPAQALEEAATRFPGVQEAAVVAVAHPRWQERPFLIVVT